MGEEMRLHFGIVAFIDILGFSMMVNEDSKAIEPRYLPSILGSIDGVYDDADEEDIDLRVFSDSVVVARSLDLEQVVRSVEVSAMLQRRFVESGIFVRGGIAYGKHYADRRVIFSEALIKAFRLESTYARVPRILVDEDLWSWFWFHSETEEQQKARFSSMTLRDRDSRIFIDYLANGDLKAHGDAVNSLGKSEQITEQSVMDKYHWLLDYHEFSASNMKGPSNLEPRPRFRGIDE